MGQKEVENGPFFTSQKKGLVIKDKYLKLFKLGELVRLPLWETPSKIEIVDRKSLLRRLPSWN